MTGLVGVVALAIGSVALAFFIASVRWDGVHTPAQRDFERFSYGVFGGVIWLTLLLGIARRIGVI